MEFVIKQDCRWFKGDQPCRFWTPCMGCREYSPVKQRVLIVMLIKLGDMLIASALPKALKEQCPGTHVSWLVDRSCAPLVRMNPHVDEVLEYSWETISALEVCAFDLVLGFERERAAAALVEKLNAKRKCGLAYGGMFNNIYPLCKSSEYFFKLNVWNDFRTRINTKTWTEFYFELAGLTYAGQPYELQIPAENLRRANEITAAFSERKFPTLICNVGASLPTKAWPVEQWVALINIVCEWDVNIILTFGAHEREQVDFIVRALPEQRRRQVTAADTCDDLGTLAALFPLADLIVSGDTLGMHLSIWANKPVIALFGPSNPAEVVPKHSATVEVMRTTFTCSPCAHQVTCGGRGGCMKDISVESIARKVHEQLFHKHLLTNQFRDPTLV